MPGAGSADQNTQARRANVKKARIASGQTESGMNPGRCRTDAPTFISPIWVGYEMLELTSGLDRNALSARKGACNLS